MKPRIALTALAATSLTLGLAACGSSGGVLLGRLGRQHHHASSPSASSDAMMADLVGPGCAAYAKAVPSGSGSVDGMAQDPVATAASNNPLLKTLVAAVSGKLNSKVNLVNTLNNGAVHGLRAGRLGLRQGRRPRRWPSSRPTARCCPRS